MKVLVYGGKGWIGSQMVKILKDISIASPTAQNRLLRESIDVCLGEARLENFGEVEREVASYQPTHILLCAGKTGRPNVDWCEDNKQETLDTNVVGAAALASLCARPLLKGENNRKGNKKAIHLTYLGTGCIYEFDKAHPMPTAETLKLDPYNINGTCPGFREEDVPNFTGSYYSKTKIWTENIMRQYPNTLTLRIRMPIADDLHPRNFITKITKYQQVVDIPNSMTCLTEMLPIAVDMLIRGRTGVYNFTNPGTISHGDILKLYKKYVDPAFNWIHFSLEDQAKILKAGRSNNCLDVSKLVGEYPELDLINVAMEKVFSRMRNIEMQKKLDQYEFEKISTNNYNLYFEKACDWGEVDVLYWIYQNYILEEFNLYDQNPPQIDIERCFTLAAESGHLKVLEFLMKLFDIEKEGLDIAKVCRRLCGNGNLGIIKWINENFNIYKEDLLCGSDNSLLLAAKNGQLEVLQYIIEKFDIRIGDIENLPQICIAASINGHADILKWIGTHYGISPC